jgi:hypothetical protein
MRISLVGAGILALVAGIALTAVGTIFEIPFVGNRVPFGGNPYANPYLDLGIVLGVLGILFVIGGHSARAKPVSR